jgi:hypothetical protein
MSLKDFYDDKQLQKDWAAFMIETLEEEALARVYAGKDTTAVKEAHDIITKSFKRLNDLFTPKRKRTVTNRAV